MSLKNSPKIPRHPRPGFDLRAGIRRHRRAWLGVCVALVALNVGLLARQIAPAVTAPPPGGVDGCVRAANQQPIGATIWADDLARRTFADGCFFFARLTPGEHTLRFVADNGVAWTQTVTIKSGQAVGLGDLLAPGR